MFEWVLYTLSSHSQRILSLSWAVNIDYFEGWGGFTSGKLLEVKVPVVSNTVCQEAFQNMTDDVSLNTNYTYLQLRFQFEISDAILCAGGEVNKGPCTVGKSV